MKTTDRWRPTGQGRPSDPPEWIDDWLSRMRAHRDANPIDPASLEEPWKERPVPSARPEVVARTERVRAFLTANPGYHTVREVAAHLGMSTPATGRALRWLADQGKIAYKARRGFAAHTQGVG